MLELHITDTNVTNGNIAVSWCLTKECINKLAECGYKNPYIVFCVIPQTIDENDYFRPREYRKAVPLKDMIAYLEFYTSGTNKIFAFLAASRKDTEIFMLKSGNTYDFDVLNLKGDDYRKYSLKNICLFGEDSSSDDDEIDFSSRSIAKPISVFVPKECFAEEPSEWEKTWVNHFFNSKCVDQCAFRRRRMFAYGVQPFLMIGNILFRTLIFIFGLIFGARGLTVNGILHPLATDIDDCLFDTFHDGTIFIGKTENKILNYITLPFMPLILAPLALLYYKGILLEVTCATLIAFSMCIVMLVIINIKQLANDMITFTDLIKSKFENENQKPWYVSEEEQQLILCTGEVKPVEFNKLPSKHKTIKLRFYDLKSKICRPFSR